ncbi:MAG: hypothetical protein K0S74_1853 [Chlamydiales bacterium]|jgi:hypothetical protein|nr:hypothetical protein [Chlamydiales bacterium]
MTDILIPDDYLDKFFKLDWFDVYCGLKYKNISCTYAINKAKNELQNENCLDREILTNLSSLMVNEQTKIIDLVIDLGKLLGVENIDEEEITNKWHYIIMKYIYDSPDVFPDQIQVAQEYAKDWNYPPEIRLFTNPYIDSEYYPGSADDVKKMRFKYWKQYLDETKEEYGWRTFKDFLKHEGISSS